MHLLAIPINSKALINTEIVYIPLYVQLSVLELSLPSRSEVFESNESESMRSMYCVSITLTQNRNNLYSG